MMASEGNLLLPDIQDIKDFVEPLYRCNEESIDGLVAEN